NDGHQHFTKRVLIDQVARVSDVRAGDLDGDGDLDLAVAQFGYDQGETRWMENQGGWHFASHMLQSLSGPINAEIGDIDGDGDVDIVTLATQEGKKSTPSSTTGEAASHRVASSARATRISAPVGSRSS